MNKHRIPDWRCEDCGAINSGAMCMTSDTRVPTPGDLTMCLKCGMLGEFDAQLRTIKVQKEKIATYSEATRDLIEQAQQLTRLRSGHPMANN